MRFSPGIAFLFVVFSLIGRLSAAAETGSTAADLSAFNLTDDQIEDRCETAIEFEVDMVAEANGEKVPRCVHVYREQRAAYEKYAAAEMIAKADTSRTLDCDRSQPMCQDAEKAAVAQGEAALRGLGSVAEESAARLGRARE